MTETTTRTKATTEEDVLERPPLGSTRTATQTATEGGARRTSSGTAGGGRRTSSATAGGGRRTSSATADRGARTAAETARSARDDALVDARLREVLDDLRRRATAHHPTYQEMIGSLADIVLGGKKFRPAIFLAAYRGLTADGAPSQAAVDVACALELLHGAFVVHDDVIDHDLVRRGGPNVAGHAMDRAVRLGADSASASRFGAASGIIAGDLLISTSLALLGASDADGLARRRLIAMMEDTVFATAAGEHADVWFSLSLDDADAARVLRTTELKTARYSFQAPLEAAAILAGADPGTLAALTEIGRGFGIVYQLRDDILGVFGAPGETGKSALGDLREGKQTMLVALARGETTAWSRVAHLFGRHDLDDAGAEQLRTVIRSSGALQRVERAIVAECRAVRAHIAEADLAPALEDYLLTLLTRCAERDA